MILDGTLGATFNDGSLQGAAASPYVLKNRIINGDMVIDQRNAGASVTINGTTSYVTDRFKITTGGGGVISGSRSTTAPTGFVNSLSNTVSTADSSIAAGDIYVIDQVIEGFNTADLGFGTANARTVTLSFWVRSSVTGTYGVRISNGSFNRSYVSTYTITSANTWQQISITIAGDTTGTWATDNTGGIAVSWDLGSGTNWNGTANTWQAGNFLRTSGCVNWIATSGATFYITGVQLEIGSTATPFERRLYNQELINCQRYCQKIISDATATYMRFGSGFCNSSTAFNCVIPFKVSMRAAPSLTTTGTGSNYSVYNATNSVSACNGVPSIGTDGTTTESASISSPSTGLNAGGGGILISSNIASVYLLFTAEL
jgi:hypothetical protein